MKLTARERRAIDPIRETDVPLFPVRKFTVAEYHKLLKVGVLRSGDPYELLRGWIVPKLRRSPRCSVSANRLQLRLLRLFPEDQWVTGSQRPITFRDSEPEPVGSLVRGPDEPYWRRHPRPRETELVIEVSDASLERDRGVKLEIYASGRIPAYWIVDIPDLQVEVYTRPRGGKNPTYRERAVFAPGDTVPIIIDGRELGAIPVNELLPWAIR
jgi:hypothetical protein